MKSILYQLKKYIPDPAEASKIIVEEEEQKACEDKLLQLARRIIGLNNYKGDLWEFEVKKVAKLLSDMPNSPYVGTLFSEEILGIYHCYYNHQTQVVSEEVTDHFFKEFLTSIDPAEYQQQFEEAVDGTAKRLAVVRVVLATSADDGKRLINQRGLFYNDRYPGGLTTSCQFDVSTPLKKEDKLPFEFRQPAEEYLGINSVAEAARLQDRLNKCATLDQIILGRMGYMMFWSWNNRGGRSNVPLLEAPRKALPRVIYLPGPDNDI